MTLTDSHCHLDDKQFDADRETTIERALAAGVGNMLAVGSGDGPPDLEAGIRLAERYDAIHATVGIHPHEARKADPGSLARLAELAAHPKVVALGEIGLDYHYDFSPRETQRAIFAEQLRIARDARLPIVIHTREAWLDTLQLLEQHWAGDTPGGIMHCFSGGPAEARRVVEMGFHVSFAGMVTFPKAVEIQDAARVVPLDRILIETDAPYLAPIPHRGKRNEPAFVAYTAHKLAELRGEPVETLTRAAATNFRRLCLRTERGSEYTGKT